MIIIKFMLYTAATIGYLVWLRIHKAPQKASIYIILGGIVFFLLGIVSHILIGEQSWQEVLLINRITFSSRLVVIGYGFLTSGILHFLITLVFPPESKIE